MTGGEWNGVGMKWEKEWSGWGGEGNWEWEMVREFMGRDFVDGLSGGD
jgi:hypothetical protein